MSGQEVATLANIDSICAGRDAAISHWLAAYDGFHDLTAKAAAACIGRAYFSIPTAGQYESAEVAKAFATAPDKRTRDVLGRDNFAAVITTTIDRAAWSALMDQLGGDSLMDRQAKEEWRASLKDPPPFTAENCKATFAHLWGSRRDLFLRGIANTFSRLDRRFRSHDGFKIGGRLIIESALETVGWSTPHWRNHDRRDTFADVERLLAELDGQPAPGPQTSIVERIRDVRTANLPCVLQGDYFRVRVFKNGNLHIWFEREDLLREVNKLLAEYYGETIGDGYNETEAESAPAYHVTPAKKFGEFFTSAEVAAKVAEYAGIREGVAVLEPSAGGGALAREARKRGGKVQCVEVQPGLAHELALANFPVIRADFLTLTPGELGQFDVVLMNPPFDRGRDCDHVRHAWQFVKPGGRLVAIMSARAEFGEDARHKALHRIIESAESSYGRDPWHDLPAGSFAHAGTMVNTAVLTLRKRA